MILAINGKEYWVDFTYGTSKKPVIKNGVKSLRGPVVRTSTAVLNRKTDEGENEFSGLLGTAFCSEKDRFEKSKGRKVAFSNLLDVISESQEFGPLSKEDRKELWRQYFSQIDLKDGIYKYVG